MPQISKRFERRPIGRQIKREINGETEPGLVSGMYSMATPEWRTVYTVKWKPLNEQEYDEHLALKTVQHYYKSDDTYANEPFVDEEIRLLQQVQDTCQYRQDLFRFEQLQHFFPCAVQLG